MKEAERVSETDRKVSMCYITLKKHTVVAAGEADFNSQIRSLRTDVIQI